jgi:hypothetical protein
MVDSPNTTIPSRLSFSSLNAIPPRCRQTFSTAALICAGLATPKPPTGIQLNFANLIDNLREEGPAGLIVGVTDQGDLEERADHLEAVLKAVTSYVKAVVGDTRYNANTNIPDETGFLVAAAADIVGSFRNKVDALAVDAAA